MKARLKITYTSESSEMKHIFTVKDTTASAISPYAALSAAQDVIPDTTTFGKSYEIHITVEREE